MSGQLQMGGIAVHPVKNGMVKFVKTQFLPVPALPVNGLQQQLDAETAELYKFNALLHAIGQMQLNTNAPIQAPVLPARLNIQEAHAAREAAAA